MREWTVIGFYKDNGQPFACYYKGRTAQEAASTVSSDIEIVGIVEGKHTVYSGE